MIKQLEAHIQTENFESAGKVIPALKALFHRNSAIDMTLDELKALIDEHDPKCASKLLELKSLLVG